MRCWWFYWNSAAGDKSTHAGIDFLPWWLNEVEWSDRVVGNRSLDIFDFHAYPDTPDYSTLSVSQARALRLRLMRDYWDPAYRSESFIGTDIYATQMQPLRNYPFRLPRMRAIVNSIYPGTPLFITEWNASLFPYGGY